MSGLGAKVRAMEPSWSIWNSTFPLICLKTRVLSPLRRGREKHPSVEVISRDRGTTKASGANRGAPQALQIADRGPLLHNLGEALEKVLARHHADLKRVFTPPEEENQS